MGGDRQEVRCSGECKWTGGQSGGSSPPAAEWKNREGADLGENNKSSGLGDLDLRCL